MVWYLPIGVYEGIKMTSEITDSTVDLSGDGEIPHAVLRVGVGAIPVPTSYGRLLEYLATAPEDVSLKSWIAEQSDSADLVKQMNDLNENGLVFPIGEYPPTDQMFDDVLIRQVARANRIPDDTAEPGDDLIAVDAGGGEFLVTEPLLDLTERLGSDPVSFKTVYNDLLSSLTDDDRQHAATLFETGLQSLVKTGALTVYLKS
ncbi:MAG: hypothetical protein ACRDTJ_21175 [Pseudonocardiaceae bacterium]